MSSSMGIHVRAPLVAVAAACWTLTLWAQAGAPPPAPGASAAAAAARRERIEAAHEDLRRSAERPRPRRRPAQPAPWPRPPIRRRRSRRRVPRHNFIDEHIFGRLAARRHSARRAGSATTSSSAGSTSTSPACRRAPPTSAPSSPTAPGQARPADRRPARARRVRRAVGLALGRPAADVERGRAGRQRLPLLVQESSSTSIAPTTASSRRAHAVGQGARDHAVAGDDRPQQPAEEPLRRERGRLPDLQPAGSRRRAGHRRQPGVPRPQHLVHVVPRRRAAPRGHQQLPHRTHPRRVLRDGGVLRQDAAHRQLERQVAQRRPRPARRRPGQGLRRRRRRAVPAPWRKPVPAARRACTSRPSSSPARSRGRAPSRAPSWRG